MKWKTIPRHTVFLSKISKKSKSQKAFKIKNLLTILSRNKIFPDQEKIKPKGQNEQNFTISNTSTAKTTSKFNYNTE